MSKAVERAKELLSSVSPTEQKYFNAHSVQLVKDLLAEIEQLHKDESDMLLIADLQGFEKGKLSAAKKCIDILNNYEHDPESPLDFYAQVADVIGREFGI